MKKSRYTDRQILSILKQAEVGTREPELCREHGMSSATPKASAGTISACIAFTAS